MVAAIQSAPTSRELAEKDRADREARRRLKEKQAEEIRIAKEKRRAKEAETARLIERQEAMARAAAATVVPSTARDPSRLIQPTAAMIERARQRQAEEEEQAEYARTHGGRTPGTMLQRNVMGHTATPAWRKGL